MQGLVCLSPFLLSSLAQRDLCREIWLVATLNIYFLVGNEEASYASKGHPNASRPSALSRGSAVGFRQGSGFFALGPGPLTMLPLGQGPAGFS